MWKIETDKQISDGINKYQKNRLNSGQINYYIKLTELNFPSKIQCF